jgi:hypothetical protein
MATGAFLKSESESIIVRIYLHGVTKNHINISSFQDIMILSETNTRFARAGFIVSKLIGRLSK